MTEPGCNEIATLLRERTGIMLSGEKCYLLQTRLRPVLRAHGLESIAALKVALRGRPTEALVRAVIEALTTHESSFFRDGAPFEHLRAALPRLLRAKPPNERLRIWSAGCAAGQEAYSIAILATETLGVNVARRVEILGTDISRAALARAKNARFSDFEVKRGLSQRMLSAHFVHEASGWRANPALCDMVRFEECNLMTDCARMGRFDSIFCRNVLIYFDTSTKRLVLERLASQLMPEGTLYLGAAETVLGLTSRLAPIVGERNAYGLTAERAAA